MDISIDVTDKFIQSREGKFLTFIQNVKNVD